MQRLSERDRVEVIAIFKAERERGSSWNEVTLDVGMKGTIASGNDEIGGNGDVTVCHGSECVGNISHSPQSGHAVLKLKHVMSSS